MSRKEDIREYRKKYYKLHKQKESDYQKEYRKNNLEKIKERKYHQKLSSRFSMLKSRAKKRGIECNISLNEFIKYVSSPCYYCNFELGEEVISGCGLDRINSNFGYINGNIVSCCKICNIIKGDFLTSEETLIAVKAVVDFRKGNNDYIIYDCI